jgi:hypothetical protein
VVEEVRSSRRSGERTTDDSSAAGVPRPQGVHWLQGDDMQETDALQAGRQVPHFRVRDLDHSSVAYSEIWQRKNLVLVLLPGDGSREADRCIAELRSHMPELTAHDTVCVMSRDDVAGAPRPGIIIADRWGEIHFVVGGRVEDLPASAGIVEWLRYVQMQCPECQGETK